MEKEIKYQGITADSSDHNASDGDLTIATNLVADKSGLVPFTPPKKLFDLPSGKILFFHHSVNYSNYIVEEVVGNNVTRLSLFDPTTQSHTTIHKFLGGGRKSAIYEVQAVGNTLVVLAVDGIHYILWKKDEAKYQYLGQKPPELNIRFNIDMLNSAMPYDTSQFAKDQGLRGNDARPNNNGPAAEEKYYAQTYRMSNVMQVDNENKNVVSRNGQFVDDYKSELNTVIWALVNSTNKVISEKGHFYAPFFVRYCYTLYDGTQYMQSVPIFMPVSSPYQYLVRCLNFDKDMELAATGGHGHEPSIKLSYCNEDGAEIGHRFYYADRKMTFCYHPKNGTLKYSLDHLSSDVADELERWSDIITSIDIFVSPPFVREKTDEQIQGLRKHITQTYCRGSIQTENLNGWDANNGQQCACVDFPLEDEELYIQRLCDVNTFYQVKTIDIKEIVDGIRHGVITKDVGIEEGVLNILATQTPLQDDYKTHSKLLPVVNAPGENLTDLYPFNARLNISCLKEQFHAFPFNALTTFSYGDTSENFVLVDNGRPGIVGSTAVLETWITLSTNEGEKCVSAPTLRGFELTHYYNMCHFPIFYPDSRATKITFRYRYTTTANPNVGQERYETYPMYASQFLNAAYTRPSSLMRLEKDISIAPDNIPPNINNGSDHDTVSYLNKIYTSEIENPFYFPASTINSVGSGTIIGIASAARPLSQGQFGQFPLYAFTTEGIWALSTSADGGYSTIQPFARDVCTNRKSITQLDSAVLFTSDRGLMSVSGMQVDCISDILQSKRNINFYNETSTDAWRILMSHAMGGWPHTRIFPDISFLEYLKEAKIMYVYTRQLIVVYRTDKSYAYVYSIPNQRWTHLLEPDILEYSINSYPNAIAKRKYDSAIFDYSEEGDYDENTNIPAFLLTRPINLDQPNTLKTISTILQRGDFRTGSIQTILYGSRDLRNWIYVSSSRDHRLRGFVGTPYKFFRIALILTLHPDESLYSASVQYTTRQTNRIR